MDMNKTNSSIDENEESLVGEVLSDDGTFFILTRENTYPHICFFKDKKPYYCWGANQDELSMEPLENYLKP